jgi:competence protein ComEA
VEGEVREPGVYAFCEEASLEAVIRRAGGIGKGCGSFNMCGTTALNSGQKVVVKHHGHKCEILFEEMCAFHKTSLSIPLSINKESQEGLTAIPGIGFNLAGAIVRLRESRGCFKTLDEVASVPGIGKVLYWKIRPYLVL